MACPKCGTDNRVGRRFCAQCGTALAPVCPSCGAANEDGSRFCGDCGSALAADPIPASGVTVPPATTERRRVSVLFADLVGFTALAEDRDPEEVREMLSRYFERAGLVIANYGGTVEKFIGDAVMAVWGAPVTQEDDPERAVRAALELTEAVAQLGHEAGWPGLSCRVGILTGEAAVDLAARGQGMVAGDLVNTASRIQSAAPAGAVWVGEPTMRATQASIAYEAAGMHDMKGKSDPVPVWWAQRVVSGLRGALRSTGLEAPFVGRERELRMVKELLSSVAEERRAHLLAVTGVAGVGKSRLAWELFKYVDGLAEGIWWHRGRCLSYGDGVTYWALAEMVRMRAGIDEGEEAGSARVKLARTVETHLPDLEERRWVESRLADLLGLQELPSREPTDLFAAWRLFFERLSDANPTILVFEDLQWADSSLLDFITYLIEWSRSHPLLIVTLARPELAERRPDWGAGRRAATALYLEPLSPRSMESLLDGLAPGLPQRIRDRIRDQAEGIPLYAVETVRMLLDRQLLVREGDVYRPVAAIEDLEVPESLQGLIAARLDGLSPEERHLLQSASVIGKSFTVPVLAALTGSSEAELEPLLSGLVRKEILGIQSDPRAPERGQYTFLQDLVRRVAYGTLSRSERRARHLRVAELIGTGRPSGDEEFLEIIAAHLLEAYQAAPDAPDAERIRERAGRALFGAGRRAASLGASAEAEHFFSQAASLADSEIGSAELEERAGGMALLSDDLTSAELHWERAAATYLRAGAPRDAARVEVRRAEVDGRTGEFSRALSRTKAAYLQLRSGAQDADLARAAAQLGRWYALSADVGSAAEPVELALELAGHLELPEILAETLNTKALGLSWGARREEAIILLRGALALAQDRDLPTTAMRAANNLFSVLISCDRFEELQPLADQALAQAGRVGDGYYESAFLTYKARALFELGDWDQALRVAGALDAAPSEPTRYGDYDFALGVMVQIHLGRGQLASAREILERHRRLETSPHPLLRQEVAICEARVLGAEQRWEESLAAARRALDEAHQVIEENPEDCLALVDAAEAGIACGELSWAKDRLQAMAQLQPGQLRPSIKAHASRLRGRLLGMEGEVESARAEFARAAEGFLHIATPFPLAVTQVEEAELLASVGRRPEAADLVEAARPVLERLGAKPWLERAQQAARQQSIA